MLTFTERQMNTAYLAQGDKRLIADIIAHLRAEHPKHVDGLADDIMAELARAGVARARGHGFVMAENLAAFVTLMFVIAPNFDCQPEIAAVLRDPTRPQETRLDVACDELADGVWAAAEANYDERAWSS